MSPRAASTAEGARDWLAALGCLGLAGALLYAAAPYRAENADPIAVDPEHSAWSWPYALVRVRPTNKAVKKSH